MRWRVSAASSCFHSAKPYRHNMTAYLKQAVDYLPAHIVFMCGKQSRVDKFVRAARDIVLALKIFS